MKVTEHLARADKTLFSFEILPPKKAQSIDGIFQTVEAMLPFNPIFIEVTYHATQVI
jgi:methylenetetrahydrofolate reductase (NADPH)